MHISDEDWGENSDGSGSPVESPASKRKKQPKPEKSMKKIKYEAIPEEKPSTKSNALYKPPTVEELNELKETQNLYNNNLFRLQIEELIKEVKIKNKRQTEFNTWFESFKKMLADLPTHDLMLSAIKPKAKSKSLSSEIAKLATHKIKTDQDFSIKLTQPQATHIFGLHKIHALPGPTLTISINLTMPKSCFNVKDFLNNRYFSKRYHFLAFIHHHLNITGFSDAKWALHNGFLPILQVNPKNSDKVIVEIHATPEENYFKPARCLPDVNNIKANLFDAYDLDDEVIKEHPTPLYNAALAHDLTLTLNQTLIENTLTELPNAQEAIKLIYVWLVQRELRVFSDFIAYVIVYLTHKKIVNKHMSSYQVVRNFWNFIAETDLSENPIALCEDVKTDVLTAFKAAFDVVILDKSGCCNVSAFLDAGVYRKVRNECRIAFKLLDDGGIHSFNSLFISKLPTELQYDLLVNLKSDSGFKTLVKNAPQEDKLRFQGLNSLLVIKRISEVLHRGLNQRAALIVPVASGDASVCFGVNLDPVHAFKFLELGPALNDPKEKEFREFWGELSSNRRFKDGSVCIAVYFETKTIREKRGIIRTILDWVVTRKLGLEYKLYFDDFETMIVDRKVTAAYPLGTNEEGSIRVIAASDELGKKLRGLNMPLSITAVQAVSDVFSFTDVFPPIATNYKSSGKQITSILENNIIIAEKKIGMVPRYVHPIESVLHLEHSSKWPRDLQCLRHMKTAFYLEISKMLEKKHAIVSSVKPDCLDVLFEGFVFRYSMYLSREIGLLKKESTNNGVTVYKDSRESRELEMNGEIIPRLTGALKGIQSQHSSFGPSTALIKRWLNAHLMDDAQFPNLVISLLNASLYLAQSPFANSTTPQIGFLRFLKFFSELQCNIQAVVVNFNDDLSKESLAELDSKLLQNRQECPPLVIATPYDNCESLFSKASPSVEVLRRVKQLARETLNYTVTCLQQHSDVNVKDLFIPNFEGFDVVINLRPLLNPLRHQQVIGDELGGEIKLEAYKSDESTKVPVTGFNPVQIYLKELRENYGDYASFFHDSYGGNVIAVLWKPDISAKREFKISNVNGAKLEDGGLVTDVDSLIEDFFILGSELVKSIDKM